MLFGATVINAETFVFSDMTTVTPVQQHLSIEIGPAPLGEKGAAIALWDWLTHQLTGSGCCITLFFFLFAECCRTCLSNI